MQNNIAIDLESLDKNSHRMVDKILADCERNGVTVNLVNASYIKENGVDCNGFFDEDELELRVACKRAFQIWIAVLAHESCHMDQYFEECACWLENYNQNDAGILLDLWLDNSIELTPEQLNKYVRTVQWYELDCEKRAMAKLRKFKVPIDMGICIQQANSYLFFYTMLAVKRKWYRKNRAPYEKKAIWERMPKRFLPLDAYAQMHSEYIALYDKYAF
ncbi:MAG: hypothetical protein KGI27_13710 [Thaumarchaeota archaeon]|nr:hypothetical protein [Nitrososphaerota archaeon]